MQESFNVLDCGIYRVISRRGSQSDEETSSLMNQSMSEEERLKEFSFVQEEDQVEQGKKQVSFCSIRKRNEQKKKQKHLICAVSYVQYFVYV